MNKTTITLHLDRHCEKFLRYYFENPATRNLKLARQLRGLVLLLVEPHSTGNTGIQDVIRSRTRKLEQMVESQQINQEEYNRRVDELNREYAGRVEVMVECSAQPRWRHRVDLRKAVWIPEAKMSILNELISEMFEREIHITVDLYRDMSLTDKDAILRVFDQYDITDEDYTMDRALRMNRRMRRGT